MWFDTPTTWPRSPNQSAAPTLALDSITEQWTPPCTMPYGWRCCAATTSSPMHSSAVALTNVRPIAVFQPPLRDAQILRGHSLGRVTNHQGDVRALGGTLRAKLGVVVDGSRDLRPAAKTRGIDEHDPAP